MGFAQTNAYTANVQGMFVANSDAFYAVAGTVSIHHGYMIVQTQDIPLVFNVLNATPLPNNEYSAALTPILVACHNKPHHVVSEKTLGAAEMLAPPKSSALEPQPLPFDRPKNSPYAVLKNALLFTIVSTRKHPLHYHTHTLLPVAYRPVAGVPTYSPVSQSLVVAIRTIALPAFPNLPPPA